MKARIVYLVEGYLSNGSFDLTAKPTAPPPQPQSAEFRSSLAAFAAAERERGIAESTLGKYIDYARTLLICAEGEGVAGVSVLDAPLLLGFMSHMREVRPGTDPCYVSGSVKPYLRHLGREDLAESLAMVLASMYFSPFSPTHFRQSRQRACAGCANAYAPFSAPSPGPPSRRRRRWTRPSGGTTAPLS